jgi:hypothetical protein
MESAVKPSLCVTLAKECHEAFHAKKLKIEMDDKRRGANGRLWFTGQLASGRHLEAPYASDPVQE